MLQVVWMNNSIHFTGTKTKTKPIMVGCCGGE
jgi:hypothetical protein